MLKIKNEKLNNINQQIQDPKKNKETSAFGFHDLVKEKDIDPADFSK